MFRGRPIRLRIPLDRPDETVTAQILCDLGCETPRIDYGKRLGRHYRYFYAISADVDLHNPGTVSIATCLPFITCPFVLLHHTRQK